MIDYSIFLYVLHIGAKCATISATISARVCSRYCRMKQQMLEGQDTDDDKLAWRVEAELRLRLDELRRTEGASSAQLASEVTQLQVKTGVEFSLAAYATLYRWMFEPQRCCYC